MPTSYTQGVPILIPYRIKHARPCWNHLPRPLMVAAEFNSNLLFYLILSAFFSISRRRSPHNRSSLLGYLLFSMNPLPPGRVPTEKKRKKKMTRVTKETYSFVKEPSKPMSSVVATGDGVDRTGVVVYSLPVISEDRS